MLDITLVTIGKIKTAYLEQGFQEYAKRLKPYLRLKIVELPAGSFRSANQVKVKDQESEKIEKFLAGQKGNNIYLLAEQGQKFNSVDFAAWLNKHQSVTLVIAGALGFSDSLYKKYPSISLSPLTFPHELARLILLEQLYRATTIINNKNYHY